MTPLSQIVDRLTETERRAARARWFVIAAIAIWLAISAAAIWAQSPGHFSRAGAIGAGLTLAAFAFVATIRSAYHTLLQKGLILILRQNLRDREGKPITIDADLVPARDADEAARDYDHNLEVVGRLFARLDRRSSPTRGAEVIATVAATLQWGYGDLIMNRALCGDWTC